MLAEFIPVPARNGRIFVVAHVPRNFSGRCVLVALPFAEEMNKTRGMLAQLAALLNARGIGVLIPDGYGTGDSDGEFVDGTVETWLGDLATARDWADARGWRVDTLLGIRFGCALALEFARRHRERALRLVFWQPALDGARVMDQFLRLRVAASLMSDRKETTAELKEKLVGGQAIEIAGYEVSPQLFVEMQSLQPLKEDDAPVAQLQWFEVLRSKEAATPAAVTNTVQKLRQAGVDVQLHPLIGEQFWASTELVVLPELLQATAAIIGGGSHV